MTQFTAQIDMGESLDFSKNEILSFLSLLMHEISSGIDVTEDTLITIQIKKNEHRSNI